MTAFCTRRITITIYTQFRDAAIDSHNVWFLSVVLHTSEPSILAQGFILEARTVSDDKPVGTFVNAHKGTKIMCDDVSKR